MLRSYASRIVAFVADTVSLGSFTKMHFPAESMGGYDLAFNVKAPIAVTLLACSPFPACVGFSNFAPESVGDRLKFWHEQLRSHSLGISKGLLMRELK